MDTATNIIENILNNQELNCSYCGKPKKAEKVMTLGVERIMYFVDCDCYQKEQEKNKKEKFAEFLKRRFKQANIGKRYKDITLEKLMELGTEYVLKADEYIKNFNPENGEGLHFVGTVGNGKTSLGHAILKKLLPDWNCLYITWGEFVNRCQMSKSFTSDENIEQILVWIAQFDFVMLDEFVINTKSEFEVNLACELLDRWYRDNKCYLLINNPCDIQEMLTVKKLEKMFDRISEQTEKYVFTHKSYRRG